MERLSEKLKDVLYETIGALSQVEEDIIKAALDRLAAYEETGLEPEEVEIMRETKADAQFMLTELCRLCDYDRLEELAKAEQEGRLVVLPCKVGDTVYGITKLKRMDGSIVDEMKRGKVLCHKVLPSGVFCAVSAEEQFGYPVAWRFEDFGRLWFLTHEEAKEALAADTNVGHTEGGST